jgi:hypothetical protein
MSSRTVIWIAFLSACAPILAAPTTVLDLGGTWQTMSLNAPDFPPADAPAWRDVDVTAPVNAAAWVCQRRTFTPPAELRGQRLFLRFEGVKYTAQVRCNGTPVGSHVGGYEPFECDVTDVLRLGAENTVEVLAGSWRELTIDPAKVADAPFNRDGVDAAPDQLLYPIGSQLTMGIWAPVTLQARPTVHIEDVYIVPSFRKKTLTVTTTVRNLGATAQDFSVGHEVVRDEAKLLGIPPTAGRVGAGDSASVRQEVPWADPPLWSPDSPVLLHLRTTLSQGNTVTDRHTERFGFRELWAEGPMFVLNGIPLHMLGNSCHPLGYTREKAEETYRICREGNINAFRLHAQPWGKAWYDVADETGMLIMHESAVWCNSRSYALADPRFWENFATHIQAQIKLHRNHPSVFAWSLENEILHVGGNRIATTEQNLANLAAVARAVDSSRLINYDADEDPKGVADIINLHYPHNFPSERLWPTDCWWLDKPKVVAGWPRTEWLWNRRKPLYIGEYLWEPGSTPDPYSIFLGDEAYLDITRGRYEAKAISWRYQIEAHRAQGLSGGCPWNIFEGGRLPDSPMYQACKTAYRPQCIIVRQWDDQFYPGATITRDLTVINDVLRPARLEARWWVRRGEADSSVGAAGLDMQPAEIRAMPVRLTAPAAAGSFDLIFTLHENGTEVFREVRSCKAVSPATAQAPAGSVALWDPKGTTGAALRNAGLSVVELQAMGAVPQGVRTVVVGEGALQPTSGNAPVVIGAADSMAARFQKFVADGGCLLVLAQDDLPAWMPAALLPDGSTYAFITRPHHPVVAGLTSRDLRLWAPDHVVSRHDMVRPERSAARVIVAAGGAGLNRSLITEVPAGRGGYLFCQLLVASRAEAAPQAAEVLARLIDYSLQRSVPSTSPLAVIDAVPGVRPLLSGAGAVLAPATAAPQEAHVVLVEGDLPATASVESWQRWVERGNTLWLHNPSQEFLERMSCLPAGRAWVSAADCPVHTAGVGGLGEGLGNDDLYWLGDVVPMRNTNWGLMPTITSHVLRPTLDPATALSIPLDQVDLSAVKIASRRPDGISIGSGGTVTAPLHIPATGSYVIAVNVGGRPMDEVFPQYLVAVDGRPIGGFAATSTEPRWAAVSGALEAGDHVLQVSFTNDASRPPLDDRNAFIAGIAVSPAPAPPASLQALTVPAALFALRVGEGTVLVDGINWQASGRNGAKARRLLCTLMTNMGVSMASSVRGVALALDAFEIDPGVAHFRKSARELYLGDTGWAQTKLQVAAAGTYSLLIEASGTDANGQFPEIEVSLDGTVVASKFLVTRDWDEVNFELELTPGEHTLRLRFTNDFYDAAQHLDRNLNIRRIAIAQ